MHYPKAIQHSFLESFLKVKVSYPLIFLALFSMLHDLGKLANSDSLICISFSKRVTAGGNQLCCHGISQDLNKINQENASLLS